MHIISFAVDHKYYENSACRSWMSNKSEQCSSILSSTSTLHFTMSTSTSITRQNTIPGQRAYVEELEVKVVELNEGNRDLDECLKEQQSEMNSVSKARMHWRTYTNMLIKEVRWLKALLEEKQNIIDSTHAVLKNLGPAMHETNNLDDSFELSSTVSTIIFVILLNQGLKSHSTNTVHLVIQSSLWQTFGRSGWIDSGRHWHMWLWPVVPC